MRTGMFTTDIIIKSTTGIIIKCTTGIGKKGMLNSDGTIMTGIITVRLVTITTTDIAVGRSERI